MKNTLLFLFLIFITNISAQESPFQLYLEPLEIQEVGGLQVFAVAENDGKWLILGGRLDGLHQRQPWSAFDVNGKNNQIIVIDPVNKQKWSAPLTSLPVAMQEQLSSTNMQFQQENDMLYFIGGYGYSNTAVNHITFDKLTAVNVPETIDAIINGPSFTKFFRQISDPQFAVTGGYLNKIYDTFYMTGGNKFDGRYNAANNPTFTQAYTNQIRKFKIEDNGTTITVKFLPAITDAENLHRRDYNVVPQIMPNGEQGLTAFSGVFQYTADLPYLNCVNIDSSGYAVNNSFAQYYNHYHCAVLPMYSESANEMHSVFFGGIAQYFDDAGVLTQDNSVPFVKTIARVTRDNNGIMKEYKLPVEMPGLLGAGSEFIPNEDLEYFDNGVLNFDELDNDTTFAGYIYGGIKSSAPNIFFVNDGTQSSASNHIFKVFVIKGKTVGIDEFNIQSAGDFMMQVYPNPNEGDFIVRFYIEKQKDVQISIYNLKGQLIAKENVSGLKTGMNEHRIRLINLENGGTFMVTIQSGNKKAVQKVIIN
jgi:hypothetical protein